jgi:hypothetical protein
LWRGVRSTKRDAWALDAFDSPSCPCLVDLGLGEAIGSHVRAPAALAPLDERLDTRVLAIRVFPGLDPAALRRALANGVRGLVLEGYGTGNLPHLQGSLIPVLREATDAGVPVVIVSQCLRGYVELSRYAGGAAAAEAGAISGGDMTVEATIAKTMIALGRFDDFDDISRYISANQVGELTLDRSTIERITHAHSRRSAWIGSSCAARLAGKNPNTSPIVMLVPRATISDVGSTLIVHPNASDVSVIIVPLTRSPATPPSNESTIASTKNWTRMSISCAPMAIRIPISRVRSATETSMMFITPMPPTINETAATEMSSASSASKIDRCVA